MKILSRDLGVDLGTANILVYADGKGVVLREPSVVAVDKNTGKILQVGAAARNMLGRTPGNVVAMRPLLGGVISDYEMTQRMLAQFSGRRPAMDCSSPVSLSVCPAASRRWRSGR